ncbi:FAD-dependent oxidoreductase [Nocardia cyriacigeorgica]|uniref:FAD-dependent oxidoreductase n=1 Tax=Nocardia cyriacigeorgica TaxID=135487 RepID=A0A5R8P7X2_9NOCA|nr:FAD-dependent oxidoreductase [Nocardia cyriacigeorgica]TLF98287.1 FAD-dependent oxidoreductase [Nocardia cyriacigeorgica]
MTVPPRGRIVIGGAGVAGATAAETLRKEGFAGSVVLVGDEQQAPYRRPMVSKELLSGGSADRARLKPESFWLDMTIETMLGRRIRRLDTMSGRLEFDDGAELDYDGLILATGGRARRLDALVPEAITLRQIRDVTGLSELLERSSAAGRVPQILILGAGLVGLEAAATMRAKGADVTVLEQARRVLERVLPEPLSLDYERLHRERGVMLCTGVRVVDACPAGRRTRVVAEDGREWVADAVIVAAGMVPNTELAAEAGLRVDDGIVVDELCRTSAPGIVAAGDVARLPNVVLGGTERIEHWGHAQSHGVAAARTLLGAQAPYAEVPWCWTTQFGRTLQSTGWPMSGTELVVRGDINSPRFLALSLADDRLVGAIGVGVPRELRAAQLLIKNDPFVPRSVLDSPDLDLPALVGGAARATARPDMSAAR